MFELFTGRVPYDGDSFMAVLTQHMFEPIPVLEEVNPETDVPPSVRAVVYKAMAKETEDRYAQMDDLRADLERALNDANYIVDHPNRESTVRFSVTKKKPPAEKIETLMDWAPPAGTTGSATRGSRAPIAVGIVVVLLLAAGGGGAYMAGLFGGRERGKDPASGGAADAAGAAAIGDAAKGGTEDVDASQRTAIDTVAEDQTPLVVPAPAKIEVRVSSDPDGAVVFVEGMGQVCSAAPCSVALEGGAPVQISAKVGDREEKTAFTPSEENRELKFDLRPKGGGSKKPKGGSGGGSGGPGAGQDPRQGGSGLKIPDLFKNN